MDKKKQKKKSSVEGHGDFGMDIPLGKGEEKKNRRERYNEDFATDGQEPEKTTDGKGELSSKESEEGKERKRDKKKKKGKNADINNELEQDVPYNAGKVINGSKGKDEMPKSMKGKVTDEKNSHSSVETQRKEMEEKSSHSCAETQRKKKKDKESNLCTFGPSEVDAEDGEFEGTKKSGVDDKERTNKKKKHRNDVKSAKGSFDGRIKTFDDKDLAKSEKFRVSDDKIIRKKEKKKKGDCGSEFKETNKTCVNDKDRKKKKRKHKDDNKPVSLVFESAVKGSSDEGTKTFDNNDLTKGVGVRSSDDKIIKNEKRKKKKKMDSDSGFQVAASYESDLCSDSKKKRKKNPVEDSCDEGNKTFDNSDLTKDVGFRGSDDKMIKNKEKRMKKKMKDSDSGIELAASNKSDLCSDSKKKRKRKSSVNDSAMAPEKQKQKKKRVSFAGAVEVFPLDGDAENEEADDSENEETEEQLIYGKRFTPEEDQKVRDAIDEYITKHQLGEEGIQMILKCKKYPQVKNCWKEIGACIPYRPQDAIYYRAHCLLERSELRKWTPEEYEEMHRFYKKHGADWRTLADKLGKHRFHVKDAWRRVKSPNFKKGNWSQDEYQSLFDLVNLDLRMKVNDEKDSKHGMLRDNIHWEAISDKLSTRYNAACCVKWYKQLTSPLVSEGLWADVDDYVLIDELKKTDACCIEDVDWDNLLEHRSGEICRRRWDQMTRHLGSNREKPFIEQIEVLSKRYCPEMVEYRK